MLLFEKLRYKNLLSTGNQFTELELNKNKMTLIVGDNGSGKSSALDALTFALFGKPFRNINKPQLVNTIIKKELVVEVEFSIGSTKYKIVRGIKPTIFEVYQNDVLLNQSAESKDYQEIVEKQILKLNYKSFCQVVVLGSASFVPFMQLPKGQRREIIEDILDLQIFTRMNSLLKDRITKNNEDTSIITNSIILVGEKIKVMQQYVHDIQVDLEKQIEDKQTKITENQQYIESLSDQEQIIVEQIANLKNQIADETKISSDLHKLEKLHHKIEARKAVLEKDVDFFKDHVECPTCKQAIEELHKTQIVSSRVEEISSIVDGLSKLSTQYDKLTEKVKFIMSCKEEITQRSLDQYRIKSSIESLKQTNIALKTDLDIIIDKSVAVDEAKMNELRDESVSLNLTLEQLEEDRQVLQVAGLLLKDGGIKAKIIKQYIPVFNKLINKYLSAMDFFVQFELDEEFNETIKSRFRDDFSYASFSEGEKMRINLAILFAWRAVAKLRNSVNTNLLIMDEVFDSSLDASGTDEFMKILNSITSDTNTFIISHKTDTVMDKFENVIRFEKRHNFSRIA